MSLPKQMDLLILGQGTTGLAVATWALTHRGERVKAVTVYGGANSQPNNTTEELTSRGVEFVYGTDIINGTFDVCVASPGISEFSTFYQNAAKSCTQIMGEPEFSFRLSPNNWCAVTGTNGKTTVTSLINELLNVGGKTSVPVGNIGNACIAEVDNRPDGAWFTAELSSYQLATTQELHPCVAVLLNITPDHLTWHKSHANYVQAKLKLLANMSTDDLAILNRDDQELRRYIDAAEASHKRVLQLSLSDPGTKDAAFTRSNMMVVRLAGIEHELLNIDEISLIGSHNVLNALAAAAAALACGADVAGVRRGLKTFKALPHRLEPIGSVQGVSFINDSKATNTDAVEIALQALKDKSLIVLLGGHDKHIDLTSMMQAVATSAKAAVCFGEARERFKDELELACNSAVANKRLTCIEEAASLKDAVEVAYAMAASGDTVLLSPGCSSFDEFKDFEQRGDAFRMYVEQLRARVDG